MTRFVEISGCAVPTVIADAVREVERRVGEQIISCDRSQDPESVRIQHAHGHHTQLELVQASPGQRIAWGVLGTPDSDRTSTHCRRNDGVAFPSPPGSAIPDYEVGQDWPTERIADIIRAYRDLGDIAINPYHSGIERHHIDLVRPPHPIVPTVQRGDTGRWVFALTHDLAICGYLPHGGWRFNMHVDGALRAFQRHHHLTVDGIAGAHTWLNLQAAARACKKHHRKEV